MTRALTNKQIRTFTGNRIKELREGEDMTQIEFARRVKRTQATISAWEAGDSMPEFESMQVICSILGRPMADLLPPDFYPAARFLPPGALKVARFYLTLPDDDPLKRYLKALASSPKANRK